MLSYYEKSSVKISFKVVKIGKKAPKQIERKSSKIGTFGLILPWQFHYNRRCYSKGKFF